MRSLTIGVVFVVILVIPHLCLSTLRTLPQLLSNDYYYQQEFNFSSSGEEEESKNVSLWDETATAASGEGDSAGRLGGEPKFWPIYNGNGSSVSGCFQDGGLTGCLKMALQFLFGTTVVVDQTLDDVEKVEEMIQEELQNMNVSSSSEVATPRKRRKDLSSSPVLWLLLLLVSKTMTTLPLALLVLKSLLLSSVSLAVALLKDLQPSAGRRGNHQQQLALHDHQMAYL